MKKIVLKTNHLTKHYGSNHVLDDINITIKQGDIYGLIGKNGAGKTTLMRVLTTLAESTSGTFEFFEEEAREEKVKQRIGCLIESPAFYGNLSAYDNLKYYSLQKGIVDQKQIEEALHTVGLENTGKKKFKNFSLGMKQRLGIALAILDHPDFIILDEPINGLDPIGISEIRDTFKRLNEEHNITILISSHILSELYMIANKFCFIDNGHIIKEITKEELDMECKKCLVIKAPAKKTTMVLENKLQTTDYMVINKNEVRLYDYKNSKTINKTLIENDVDVEEIYESGISLEDYFKTIIKGDDNRD